MKIENLKVGESYTYQELCARLDVEYSKGSNKKVEFLEKLESYCKYERPDNRRFVITEIFESPLPTLDDGYFYKTMIIPVKCSNEDYSYLMQCSRWAGDCWNAIVKADNECYKTTGKFMSRSDIQKFVKNITPLHAVGNQHVFTKYYSARDAMFRSRKSEHENNDKVKLPYRKKKYFVVGWNVFSYVIDYRNKIVKLAKKADKNKKQQPPVICTFKTMPKHVVEIELVYRNGLCLAIKYKEQSNRILQQTMLQRLILEKFIV